MDKRGQKTLNSIANAFNKLLLSKSFDAITVTDICDEALISRKTFYTYYEDKYELIDRLATDALNELDQLSHGQEDKTSLERITIWLTYIQERQELFKILFNRESSYSFKLKFQQYLQNSLKQHGDFEPKPTNLAFYVQGTFGVVEAYVNGEIKAKPAELAQELVTMIPLKAE
ncbi:AcrR family transcriptional regulator [Weissella uvarum]|uniref:TetR/AcrR family transcriptional regulator C-terminal domain-containing protein n=1 Tax=Weissella uvarum TaxID=1479233 RepID=UPI00195F2B61|nr:TetR/AcrR family transcriptional regulator C-terminal domain-containing protein [Weissella uvarum]MBM7617216.1 AcrR family transcriptional regulator [Weissella uvarum]MCM0595509.1 TetR/AcrR family transcriptional regulator C-terminal domain-containing protein [Weissella uvarum]